MPPGIKHRFSWCMTRQPCVWTKVTLNTSTSLHIYVLVTRIYVRTSRTRDDMFVTESAGRAAAHLWRMPGFSRTSINTAQHWSDLFSHTGNLPSTWLCWVISTSLSFSHFRFISSNCPRDMFLIFFLNAIYLNFYGSYPPKDPWTPKA